MIKEAQISKFFRYQQKSAWCGPAVIQMALAAAGIKIPQAKIAKDVMHKWWGTTQQSMFAYLSRFFGRLNYKENSTLPDIKYHLKKGHVIIVNWWDNIDTGDEEDGHYSLLVDYNYKTRAVTLGDPAAGRGIWDLSWKNFKSRWYDSVDINNKKWIKRWMLWIDPKSATRN